jgi:putative flippase GtrA
MFPFSFEHQSAAVAAGSISGLVFNFATIKLYVFKSEAKTRKDI